MSALDDDVREVATPHPRISYSRESGADNTLIARGIVHRRTTDRCIDSARAAEETRLLILYKTDFVALMDSEAHIALVIMRNLSRLLASYARQNAAAVARAESEPL